MRRFLFKTSIALLLALAVHLIAGSFADGRFDDSYLRFTGGRRTSLILGTSHAAQGLRPAVIDPFLKGSNAEGPLFNFAFTIVHSPYGPTYMRAVEAKLDKHAENGIFLLAVDPWSLCMRVDKHGRMTPMQETKHDLLDQFTFTGTPNYEYLVRHAQAGWGSLIGGPLHTENEHGLLHEDGWLEIQVPLDSAAVSERTAKMVKYYRATQLPRNRPSQERIAVLKGIIDLLDPHGSVYLVRIPVCDSILAFEDQVWPTFDEDMDRIASEHDVPYWNFMPVRDRYSWTDGHHIDTNASRVLSSEIGRRLAADRNARP